MIWIVASFHPNRRSFLLPGRLHFKETFARASRWLDGSPAVFSYRQETCRAIPITYRRCTGPWNRDNSPGSLLNAAVLCPCQVLGWKRIFLWTTFSVQVRLCASFLWACSCGILVAVLLLNANFPPLAFQRFTVRYCLASRKVRLSNRELFWLHPQ